MAKFYDGPIKVRASSKALKLLKDMEAFRKTLDNAEGRRTLLVQTPVTK